MGIRALALGFICVVALGLALLLTPLLRGGEADASQTDTAPSQAAGAAGDLSDGPDDELRPSVLDDFAKRLNERIALQKARRVRAFEAPNATAMARFSRDVRFAYAALDAPAFSEDVMRRASFLQASLNAPVFADSALEEVDFSSAFLLNPDFSNATVRNVRFIGARVEEALFDDASLKHVAFYAAQIINASFQGAAFNEVSFDGAFLSGVNFRNADLSDARFHGTVFDDVDFKDALAPAQNAFEGACRISGPQPDAVAIPLCVEVTG